MNRRKSFERIEIIETQLTPSQRLEALKIAHETKDPEVKIAAMALLIQPILVMVEPRAPEFRDDIQ